jgi:non-homologous end joining protein Ku
VRPTWKGFLKLSLVNIPCGCTPRPGRALSFNQILGVQHPDRYDEDALRPASDRRIVKGHEYAKGST